MYVCLMIVCVLSPVELLLIIIYSGASQMSANRKILHSTGKKICCVYVCACMCMYVCQYMYVLSINILSGVNFLVYYVYTLPHIS